MLQRIQKIISASGYCSRRAAEKLIEAGRVSVNGKVAQIGDRADDESDTVLVDGRPLHKSSKRTYIMLNKPRGYVTTMSDRHGRPTVAHLTSDVGVRVYPVGRLDMDSEGLLIMTDDGELTNFLTHPSNGVKKVYLVHVKGECNVNTMDRLLEPMEIDGAMVKAVSARCIFTRENKSTIEVCIREGRNRQVRKMCKKVGLEVLRLRRTSVGSLELGALPSGHWRHLTDEELENLQKVTE